MARIAIFCDGTWNSPRRARKTHVQRLYQAALKTPDQVPIYIEGVGTGGRLSSMIGKTLNMLGGGAFGWGLNDNIKEAYRALAHHYKAGDSIHIYGFSRGAYTARSLAGMIRKVGIVEDLTEERLEEAFALYRMSGPENAPDLPHILARRRRLCPQFATSQVELDWRLVNPLPDQPEEEPTRIEIEFLGIWDTVGALGVPSTVLGPIALIWNRKHQFHDTMLSRMVRAARHALALDERRVFFRPALWDNLEQTRAGEGLNRGDRSDARAYQQVWFIGTHSIVGGSARSRALTSLSLEWMAEGARNAGLELRQEPPLLDHPPDPLAEGAEVFSPPLVYRIAGALLEWRKGPGHAVDLHASAAERVAKRSDYRPLSLRALRPDLFGGQAIGVPQDPRA